MIPPWPQHADVVRVLLVDDEENEFLLLRSTLADIRGTRFELDWAPSYGEGLKRICDGGYDAHLIDYRLGAFTGVDLLREARASGSQGPLIMLTGDASRVVDMEAMEAGATDFLQKGKTPPELLERTLRYAITHTATTEALRRSLRQVSAMEALGRLLSDKGPAQEVLDEVMRLLAEDFGVTHASLYLVERDTLELAAVHGYPEPAPFVDMHAGRLAGVMASGRRQTIPNVTVDPDHRTGAEPMELCLPFMAEGACIGILNVASPDGVLPLELERGLRVIADRLAVGLALNRAVRGRSFIQPPATGPS